MIHFSKNFIKKSQKLIKKQPKLRVQLKKQFALFQQDPAHVGLRLHKLKGKRDTQYAIWIYGDLRAVAIKENDDYTFFDLVTHDEY